MKKNYQILKINMKLLNNKYNNIFKEIYKNLQNKISNLKIQNYLKVIN